MMGYSNTNPSTANRVLQDNNSSQNVSRERGHELERQSFDSGKKILALVPEAQEYRVHISKTPSSGSTNARRFSEDQIRVRNEVWVDTEGTVG